MVWEVFFGIDLVLCLNWIRCSHGSAMFSYFGPFAALNGHYLPKWRWDTRISVRESCIGPADIAYKRLEEYFGNFSAWFGYINP